MPKIRRVVFSFDDRSLESLKRMQEQGRTPDAMPCPRCLRREQGRQEYTEVTVKNPETGEERVIVIPKMESGK